MVVVGGLLNVREDISSKELNSITMTKECECIIIKINVCIKKWLIGNFYNPNKHTIGSHLNLISKHLDHYYSLYDNILLLGDFNAELNGSNMKEFVYNLKNILKVPTCFKNLENPSCIDLILTNRTNCFQNTMAFKTGLSDFHKMTVTILKAFFNKKKRR